MVIGQSLGSMSLAGRLTLLITDIRGTHRDAILFLIVTVVWGTSFVAIRIGLHYFPPVLFVTFGYAMAGSLLLLTQWRKGKRWFPSGQTDVAVVLMSGTFMFGIYSSFVAIGQQTVTSAVAAIIIGLIPVLTTGFSRYLLPRKRLNRLQILGIVLGFIGIGIVANPNPSVIGDGDFIGEFFIFLAAAGFALGSVIVTRFGKPIPQEITAGWSMLLGAGIMYLISLVRFERIAEIEWTMVSVSVLIYFGVTGTTYVYYYDLLKCHQPVKVNLALYLAPIVAAVTGWVLLREALEIHHIVGFCVIIISFMLVKFVALRSTMRTLTAGDH